MNFFKVDSFYICLKMNLNNIQTISNMIAVYVIISTKLNMISFIILFWRTFDIIMISNINTAYEYVLMDMDSGRVIASKNMHSPKLIASITKIMTT